MQLGVVMMGTGVYAAASVGVVQALMERDTQTARAVMEKHLNRYRFDEAAMRQAYPDFFAPDK